jgi:hypothetical protein
MWCRQCQQDVPAIPAETGRRTCPRCRGNLDDAAAADSGIELEAFDRPVTGAIGRRAPSLVDDVELRRISQKLRPWRREPLVCGQSQALTWSPPPEAPRIDIHPSTDACVLRAARRSVDDRAPRAWGVSLVMALGLATLAGGVGAIGAHAAGRAPIDAWQWGLAALLAGQGLLVMGSAWMTARLWRNSRRLNRQVEAFERRLANCAKSEWTIPRGLVG